MKPRLPLSSKVLFVAFLNLCLLGLAIVLIARVEFRFDPGSFLLAPAQNRIISLSHALALELDEVQPETWNQVVSRYAAANHVTLVLFDETGERLAGPEVALPREISERLPGRQRPPRPGQARTGRRPRDDRPKPDPRNPPDDRRPPGDHNPPEKPPPDDNNRPPDGRSLAEENPATSSPAPPLFLTATSNPTQYWAAVRIPVRHDRQDNPHPGTLIFTTPSLMASRLFFDATPWVTIALAGILISMACWLPFIRGLTRSISQMTSAAERIAEGQFEVHVSDQRRDEIGQLGTAVNRMASRLAAFVNGQKTFLSGIAHELCNPIATIQFGLGSLERRVDEAQRDAVADIQEEVQHMSALVNELLSFSRAGMKALDIKMGPVNVAATVARVLEREASPDRHIEVSVDPKLNVLADPEYLFRALSNLVRNAIRYAGHAGPIRISARGDSGKVYITVADQGPGVPEEALEEIFAPFYRVDPSRNPQTGGVGLGLAIVKSCIEACQGTVHCRNRQPSGLEVELSLTAAEL